MRHGVGKRLDEGVEPASIVKCEPPKRLLVVPTRINTEPARLPSIDTALVSFTTGANPEINSVGGIWIVRPSWVTNWLLSESLPEMNGARNAFAPS